jgi:gas vesicle protein
MNGNGNGGAHLILAFLAGAVTGACAALLIAPQSGDETRDSLRGWARDAESKAGRVPLAVKNAAQRASEAARTAFNEAMQEGVEEKPDTADA